MGAIAQRLANRTGALVRTDPLPVGRYWIDIFRDNPANLSVWEVWLANYQASGNVVVTKTESRVADSGGPARDWYVFEVRKPTGWGIAQYVGWPNTAPSGIQTSDDTVQKPPPEKGPLEEGGFFDKAKPWLIGGAILVGVVAAASLAKSIRG
jgi:hypothetical protein